MNGRLAATGALALALASSGPAPSSAEQVGGRYALVHHLVGPIRHRACQSTGSGLAVGDGLVLTAAHIFLTRRDLAVACRIVPGDAERTRSAITVQIHGNGPVPAKRVAAGRRVDAPSGAIGFPRSGDYALLRTGMAAAAASPIGPCPGDPRPGRAVLVVLRDGMVRTRVALDQTAKAVEDRGFVDLDRLFANGDSGAGVLDAAGTCVLGLISHRFPEPNPTVTRMTPVAVFVDSWRSAVRRRYPTIVPRRQP